MCSGKFSSGSYILIVMVDSYRCNNCLWYDKKVSNVFRGGFCRKNPPMVDPSHDVMGTWPIVKESDWCGEFSPGSDTTEL